MANVSPGGSLGVRNCSWTVLGGVVPKSQGCFKLCCQTKFSWPASKDTNRHVSQWVPGLVGLLTDRSREGLELSHRVVSGSVVRARLADLPLGTLTGRSPGASLDWQNIRPFQDPRGAYKSVFHWVPGLVGLPLNQG